MFQSCQQLAFEKKLIEDIATGPGNNARSFMIY